jgi:hypothetical protein
MSTDQTPIVDNYLESLKGMQEAKTSAFFYARVKNKMKKRSDERLVWRPVFAIGILLIFLFINFWMIKQQKNESSLTTSPSLQSFARAYDFSISNY